MSRLMLALALMALGAVLAIVSLGTDVTRWDNHAPPQCDESFDDDQRKCPRR